MVSRYQLIYVFCFKEGICYFPIPFIALLIYNHFLCEIKGQRRNTVCVSPLYVCARTRVRLFVYILSIVLVHETFESHTLYQYYILISGNT